MKKTLLKSLAAATVFAGSTVAYGQLTPEDITVDTEFAFESEYSFRGSKLGGPSMQPGMEIGVKDAYFGTWMSMPLSRGPGAGDNEVDFYVGYVFTLNEMVELDIGYTYYWYPEGGSDREPFIGAAFDVFLDPALYLFYETESETFTLELSGGYAFDLEEMGLAGFELDLGAYVGLIADTDEEEEWVYYGLSADIVYALNEVTSFSIGARFAGNSDDALGGEPQHQLWWGTAVSMAF